MDDLRFDWDPLKSVANERKHGVSFIEARTVFYDEKAIEFYDKQNSIEEDRFVLLGQSALLKILVVCHCERSGGDVVRIISARKATPGERRYYGGDFK